MQVENRLRDRPEFSLTHTRELRAAAAQEMAKATWNLKADGS